VAFSYSLYAQMKWKKLLADDGVEIVVYTMLAWAFLFVLFVLNSHFQAVVMAKHLAVRFGPARNSSTSKREGLSQGRPRPTVGMAGARTQGCRTGCAGAAHLAESGCQMVKVWLAIRRRCR
jgi:hypothetical protein